MDFEDLERKVKDPDNKLLILSNPHNPVGRAWTAEELTRLGDLCAENCVLLISDEIHADLMMKGVKHTSVGTLSEKIKIIPLSIMLQAKLLIWPVFRLPMRLFQIMSCAKNT